MTAASRFLWMLKCRVTLEASQHSRRCLKVYGMEQVHKIQNCPGAAVPRSPLHKTSIHQRHEGDFSKEFHFQKSKFEYDLSDIQRNTEGRGKSITRANRAVDIPHRTAPPHTHTSLWVFFLVWGVLFFIEIEFISGWISKPHIKFFLRHYSLGQMSAGGVW